MAHVYSGVASQYATSVVIPDDGDKVTATRANVGDGPVNPGLKQGMDNSTWLLTNEQSVPPGILRCGVVSRDGTTLDLAARTQHVVLTSGIWYTLTNAADTVTPATVLGSALANSARYYLYHGQSGYNVSTTAPEAYLSYKTGSSSALAYVCTFATDGSGIIVPFSKSPHGVYRYTEPVLVLNVGASPATTYTDISLLPYVPPTTTLATLQAQAFYDAGTDTVEFRTKGVTASGYGNAAFKLVWGTAAQTANVPWQFEIMTNTSQVVQYKFGTGGVAAGISVSVVGFVER